MSGAHALPHGRAWLWVLVLLLALLVPGAHAEAHATPVVAGDVVQHDDLDTALRPPSRAVPHLLVPVRPAPLALPADGIPHSRPPAAPRSPYALRALCSVVLRC
ncbi:hypothetical protein [Streptomyces sp. NPDC001508]|uniref:hypothetical protein n=1 Tax=Streptomyces sp. NPDC001508 TaxID=3154656 RepID=UPI00331AB1A6